MTHHLTDGQLTEALFDVACESVAAHLADCGQCREELERLRAVLTAVRRQIGGDATRPPSFWHQQRLAIREGMSDLAGTKLRGTLWAAATVALVFVVTVLSLTEPARLPLATESAHRPTALDQPVDPDELLLVEVERSVRRSVPRALEPATLIAQELLRAAEARKDQRNP